LISGPNDDNKHALLGLCRDNYNVVEPVLAWAQDCGRAGSGDPEVVDFVRARVSRAAENACGKALAFFGACGYDERVSHVMLGRAAGYLSLYMGDIRRPFGDLELDHFLWMLSITFAALGGYFLKIRDYAPEDEPSNFAREFDTRTGADDPFPSGTQRNPIFRIKDLEDLIRLAEPFTFALEARFSDISEAAHSVDMANLRRKLAEQPDRVTLRTHGVNPVQTTE
jgi:hypothetical protein